MKMSEIPLCLKGCRLPCSDHLPPSNDTFILQETDASRNGGKKVGSYDTDQQSSIASRQCHACFHTPDSQYYSPLVGIIPGPTSTSIIGIVKASVSSIMTVLGIATVLVALGA